MAEGTTENGVKAVCTFYLYSSCKKGSKCTYSHDNTRKCSTVPCRFFLSGACMYGEKCWFLHSSPKVKEIFQNKTLSAKPSLPDKRLEKRDLNESNFFTWRNLVSENLQCSLNPPNWVNAQEFVPKTKRPTVDDGRSYADSLKSNISSSNSDVSELCNQFLHEGRCDFLEDCSFVHGNFCELCRSYCLNPSDETQRKLHMEWCEKELERDMELSFAISESVDKTCGICMDVVSEKYPLAERRFGILENCSHVFCLSCIRKWRQVLLEKTQREGQTAEDPTVTRACPECRILSYFIVPSQFWVDNGEAKEHLISEYKLSLSKKQCKYFKQGNGVCPFSNSCFYLHSLPDGTKVDLPPVRRRQNQDGELDFVESPILWDFLEARENLGDY